MATDNPLDRNESVRQKKEYAIRKADPLDLSKLGDLEAIDALITKEANTMAALPEGSFARMVATAKAVNALRVAITPPIMSLLMELQGSRLGFRTDKDTERRNAEGDFGYEPDVVRDVAIEALLAGARMTGNEVNIIARNSYLTKEFFRRKIQEIPGITDYTLELGVPVMSGEKGALVEFRATWKIKGVPDSLEAMKPAAVPEGQPAQLDKRICVKVNAGMGADAILGKAERKAGKRIYEYITGRSTLDDGDVNDPPVEPKKLDAPPENSKKLNLQEVTKAITKAETEEELEALHTRESFGLSPADAAKLLNLCETRRKQLRRS